MYKYDGHVFLHAVQERVINHAAGSHGVSGIFMKYDISSLMVKVTEQHMPLWQFLVRLCGIVGGIFSTTGKYTLSLEHIVACWMQTCTRAVNSFILRALIVIKMTKPHIAYI